MQTPTLPPGGIPDCFAIGDQYKKSTMPKHDAYIRSERET